MADMMLGLLLVLGFVVLIWALVCGYIYRSRHADRQKPSALSRNFDDVQ